LIEHGVLFRFCAQNIPSWPAVEAARYNVGQTWTSRAAVQARS
jgi:hypothetical protein